MTTDKSPKIFSQAGFTLVELLIALVIAALGMTAILVANMGQSQSYNTQLQIANARQKARSVIAMLRSDFLMAATFNAAGPTSVDLTRRDGVRVVYQWSANDSNGNGLTPELLRQENGAPAPPANVFAESIDGIEFFYSLGNGPPATAPANLNDITTVTISLVSRTDNLDTHFRDADTYRTASHLPWVQTGVPANRDLNSALSRDNYHRRFWQETVACRNMVP